MYTSLLSVIVMDCLLIERFWAESVKTLLFLYVLHLLSRKTLQWTFAVVYLVSYAACCARKNGCVGDGDIKVVRARNDVDSLSSLFADSELCGHYVIAIFVCLFCFDLF